jgi:hypothetical protein
MVMAQLFGESFAIPLDIEPILAGEDEVAAVSRLMERLWGRYPKAFEVVTADGLYGREGFINLVRKHSKHILFVLKENNPDLLEDANGLFASQAPRVKKQGSVLYERSLENKPKGKTSDWYWGTTLPKAIVSTDTVCRIGHKRWEIGNQGLNVLVNYFGLDHCFKHERMAIVAFPLVCFLACTLFQMF